MAETEATEAVAHSIHCSNCGATVKYVPGTNTVKCEFCGTVNDIAPQASNTVVEGTDLLQFLDENNVPTSDKYTLITVTCTTCGASSTLRPNVVSDNCPFCGNAIVAANGIPNTIIKPKYLLPFAIDQAAAFEDFKGWIKGLWFAPSGLQRYAANADKLTGVYIPYWSYDANSFSQYAGRRGDDYTVQETYTEEENGQTVTKTRSVTRTRWTFVSGRVSDTFFDVLVMASKSIPESYTNLLEPWDVNHLVNYDDNFLAGFKTQVYQLSLRPGFDKAKLRMDSAIRNTIRQDIGGDHQEIDSVNTNYSHIKFKHILLPIWISAYTFKNKIYHFMINGRTGKVRGERPYSAIKITLFVMFIIAVIVAMVVFFQNQRHY